MKTLKGFFLLVFSTYLLACSSPSLDNYEGTSPSLDLKEFFNGELRAYGMLQNRSGVMTRRFTASIDASWDGDQGTLIEEFQFDDGEVEYRTWHLTDLGNQRYTGTAGDVIGDANGSIIGSVFQWQYVLDVPYKDSTIEVKLDDWLYLIDENHLINKTRLSKFGFKVGELTLLIEKL
jgi:hypothetical protein